MTVSNATATATATFAIDQIAMEVFLQASPELHAVLLAEAERGKEFARSIAPVGTASHILKSGYVDNPGDYRDSIEATVVQGHRRQIGRVSTSDYKRFWIEYGAKHMPKYAVLRKTLDHLKSST
jgi:hypothetical protein